MMGSIDRNEIEWLGMRFCVPPDWEIVRHSPSGKSGSLVFVDRRRQRMQLSWTECPSRPDTVRIFEDFRARDRAEVPDCTLGEIFKRKQWKGYRRGSDGNVLTRCGLYDRKNCRWVDLVLLWGSQPDEKLEAQILDSFCTHCPVLRPMRWQAFRLDMESPPLWELETAEVKPGRVSMAFRHKTARASVTRLGAPDAWFDGHVENFLRRQVGDVEGRFGIRTKEGHEACTFVGKERHFHLRWLVGRRHVRSDVAWHCPQCHAVFQVMTMAPGKVTVKPEDFTVNCCGKGNGSRA